MSVELVAIGLVGLVLGLAAGLVVGRRSALDGIRRIVGGRASRPVEESVRDLRDRSASLEHRLALREEDLTFLVGLVGTGIVRLDDDLRVTVANRAAHVFLEAGRGSLVGRRVVDGPVAPRTGDGSGPVGGLGQVRVDGVARTAWRNGSAADEIPIGGAEGRILAVRGRKSPGGGVWLVIEDISELRRLQRIRTEFIDNLSHELRTPLTTVRLLTETLSRDLEDVDLPPRIGDAVQKIDVETGHLVQMATELLDLAKIEQGGGPPLYLDDVDLGPIVTSVLDRLRLFADRQRVTLRSELDPAVPPILGDAERLGQLLVNLVHNAIKFSPAGGDVTVRTRWVPSGGAGSVVVEVEDHGVGIPSADQPRVFERFYKVDKARVRGQGGTGLGLAIARHIAEDHGGTISVESTEGRGSTFTVSLPAAAALPGGEPARAEPRAVSEG